MAGRPRGPIKARVELHVLPDTRRRLYHLANERGTTLSGLVEDWVARETRGDP